MVGGVVDGGWVFVVIGGVVDGGCEFFVGLWG